MSHVSQAATEPVREAEGGFLALMRYRNYALLWTGQLVSLAGDRFHWIAISLWVYAQTGSALSVSYAMMALMVGPAVVGVFAGALVDRLDRRKILIYGDLVRAVLVFAIPDLMDRGIVWVYVDLFLVSAASAFFRPAMLAAIPQSVPKDRLLQANAFFASMDTSTEIFGPALAGLVIAGVGYAAAIYVDAFSYVISAIFVSALRLGRAEPADGTEDRGQASGVLKSIREGLRYIRDDRIQVSLLAHLLGGFWVAGLTSLQTPMAKGVLAISDQQFGWFQSIWGIGFVSASLLLGWYGGRIPKGLTIVFAYLLWALAAGMMGLSANYGMLVVTGFWVGFANILVFVNAATVMMEYTPPDRIGRVVTTRQVLVALMRVTALLGFGWLADAFSVRAAILAMASISFIGTLGAAIRFPTLRRYRVEDAPTATKARAGIGEAVAATMSPGIVTRFLDTHTDPQFIISEQRWLNAASLLIVGMGWLVLLTILPVKALGIGAATAGTIAVATLARSIGRRLRAPSGGHERSGGGVAP